MRKFEIIRIQFKFTVYGHKQASRHTHASCNAVPLVWDSLRLAPVTDTRLVPVARQCIYLLLNMCCLVFRPSCLIVYRVQNHFSNCSDWINACLVCLCGHISELSTSVLVGFAHDAESSL